MEERWIIVPGFPGYRVSDMGRVQTRKVLRGPHLRDVHGEVWKDMKGCRHKSGHYTVHLRQGGETNYRYIHELVLTLFVGPCPPGLECCHENDIPSDNRLANLRWDTHRNNAREASRNGRWHGKPGCKGMASPFCKLTDAQVAEIRRRRSTGEKLKPLAAEFNVTETHICRLALGQMRLGLLDLADAAEKVV